MRAWPQLNLHPKWSSFPRGRAPCCSRPLLTNFIFNIYINFDSNIDILQPNLGQKEYFHWGVGAPTDDRYLKVTIAHILGH